MKDPVITRPGITCDRKDIEETTYISDSENDGAPVKKKHKKSWFPSSWFGKKSDQNSVWFDKIAVIVS